MVIRIVQVSWVDPALAIGLSIFVLMNVLRYIKESPRIILQHVPDAMSLDPLCHDLEHIAGVNAPHDLRAWSLDGRHPSS